ncbi:uncharacterized protein J7T55_001664 [Diaporthe amygdali]|uniref:uncharacterized protein n=1 Tax=Phomopsis amygdali TaxID=1214568 RepID=UPI0022FE31DD|nr:uncharacterized protein J7T55_001664 [Diaporthe amygdali]KAJ0115254.1 uncharacterized protein J7T55_001664 [Diaporthe amygdali]
MYDLVVYGSTSGAVATAIQSSRLGSATLGGLNLELHQRISRQYGRLERLNEVVEKKLKDPDVWRFEARVAEQVFVEATYEGDLLAACSISWTRGRESSATYSESLAGVRAETLYRQIDVDVDPYTTPNDPSSALLFGISPEPFGTPGDGDLHLQSYSYRIPLTDDPGNLVPFTKPDGYDSARLELHRRFAKAGGQFYPPRKRLPGRKTDLIGSEGALSTDLVGMNDEWPVAGYKGRDRILEDTKRFTKGFLWFLATDEVVPESIRKEWSRFGYCRDEFPDNGHFPRELYVRDARRMISDYIVTQETASQNGEAEVSDPVAVAHWPTDTHSVRRIMRDGRVHNEGFIFKDGHHWRPFGIAYRALLPRREEASNFVSVTCPSSSHVGYGEYWSLAN